MKAMLLAAGLGKRLKPITDNLPKPLIEVAGRTLIEHHIARLKAAGFEDIVVNLHHLGDQIKARLGDGSSSGVNIRYSVETELLETGGGVKKALPMLGDSPFLVISADTYLEFDLSRLRKDLPDGMLGLLLMTNNPPHHLKGDYALGDNGMLRPEGKLLTYTGTGILHPDLVRDVSWPMFTLKAVFDEAIRHKKILGLKHKGYWCDVGTESRLTEVREKLEKSS